MLRAGIWEISMENDDYEVVGARGDCRSGVSRIE